MKTKVDVEKWITEVLSRIFFHLLLSNLTKTSEQLKWQDLWNAIHLVGRTNNTVHGSEIPDWCDKR